MEQTSTDREVLVKGIKRLAISVLFLFAGPILIYKGAGSEHPIIFLMPGIAFAILAVVLIFQGINLILDSMFKSNKTR
ncbi:MAG: uncharacterized BrkB/YihY/UPF0761 family membrane protein [Nonlabens sp.]|jgi:uncharacterized BrkB/YihY/UPF0761 family membrane protein|uniref:DUF6095 family protein n=1 Tax=Nonlabens sp. MB-3u-79 TaxID=2058134 RepID=UPI000C317DE0|nr:DUF6095 family protein [Nonlabens sp. MB-3u-79]AUC79558.1 hypothetical protein CW736_09340 [Nonlabens sp. MB-3u-79]|tara:strand:+ start:1514 stop:1747 length:234 start_codon:yes stop_codon:yes gene_type:complete